jgi:hypothetical protein
VGDVAAFGGGSTQQEVEEGGARLRLTGNGDEVVLYPSHRGGWGRSATSARVPCHSRKLSSTSATIHTSWNCGRLTTEPRQLIDTQAKGCSLETTALCLCGENSCLESTWW